MANRLKGKHSKTKVGSDSQLVTTMKPLQMSASAQGGSKSAAGVVGPGAVTMGVGRATKTTGHGGAKLKGRKRAY